MIQSQLFHQCRSERLGKVYVLFLGSLIQPARNSDILPNRSFVEHTLISGDVGIYQSNYRAFFIGFDIGQLGTDRYRFIVLFQIDSC